ncbi:MAG: ParB/RepB/Spo0J family partition protein [Methylobacter sp.]|nr:ParB/RepB/Spo0J family partition protein [Methylobacter sp.]
MSKNNAFLDAGIDSLFGGTGNPNEYEIMVNLDDIEVGVQVREEFEDEENGLAEFGRSLRLRQLHAIVIRPNREDRDKPFLLVAGERRIRAANLEGLAQLRARVMEMNDEEAEDMQLIENIHRKNLTQIEEAKKIQRDLDRFGSVEAVLEKHHKSRAWLSKVLSLLNLPEQAKRLVIENVSADIEVINTVKTIEKLDPVRAKGLVDDLKETRGKSNARDKAAAIKEEVKPSKKPKKEVKNQGKDADKIPVFAGVKTETLSDDPFNDGDDSVINTDIKTNTPVSLLLDIAYTAIFVHGNNPKTILDTMSAEEKGLIDTWLRSFYDMGANAKDAGRAALRCLRTADFSGDGAGAFALVSFMYGVDIEAKYSLLNIFGGVKP